MGKIWTAIQNAVADFSSLEIRTFTGDIQAEVPPADGFNMATILGLAAGRVSVVAISEYKLDGDVDQFIQARADPNLLKAHNDAVIAGQEARNALFDLVKSLKELI